MEQLLKIKVIDDFSKPFSKLFGYAEKAESSFHRIGKSALSFNSIVQGMGTLSNAFEGLVNVPIAFEAQMSKVAAVSGATGEEFKAMRDEAMRLGGTTAFSAKQAGEGLEFLARAGFKSNQAIAALPGVLDLAQASGVELGKAADITSNIMGQFQIDASQTGKVADILAKTTASANVDMTQLSEAMKMIGPTANTAGVGLADVATMVGFLGDAGIHGTMATTTLATKIGTLAAPSKQAQKAMQALGYSIFDAKGDFIGFENMIYNLEVATAGLSKKDQLGSIQRIFGDASGKVQALMKKTKDFDFAKMGDLEKETLKSVVGLEKFNEIMQGTGKFTLKGGKAMLVASKAIKDSGGHAANMAKIMNDNLQGDLKGLGSAWDDFLIRMNEAPSGFMRNAVQSVTGFVRQLAGGIQGFMTSPEISGFGAALSSLFSSSFEGAKGIGNALVPAIKSAAQAFTPLVLDFKGFLSFANENAFTPIISGLGGLANFLKENTFLVKGLAVAFGTYTVATQLFTLALGAKTLAMTAWTSITKIATIAQTAFNIVASLNPFVAITAGIIVLGGLFVAFYQTSETFRAGVWGVVESLKNLGMTLLKIFVMPTQMLFEFGKLLSDVLSGKGLNTDGLTSVFTSIKESFFGIFSGYEEGRDAHMAEEKKSPKNVGKPAIADKASAKESPLKTPKLGVPTPTAVTDNLGVPMPTTAPPSSLTNTLGSGGGGKIEAEGIKNFTINIGTVKTSETLTISTTNLKEGASEIKEAVLQALMGAINDTQNLAGA